MDVVYKPSKTLKRFHLDDSFVKTVIGPIGSGKSVGCIADLLIRSHKQAPDAEGVRRTRWVIIRNTYRELIDTTIVTFHEWIPEFVGKWSAQNMKFTMVQAQKDGTVVHIEWLFRALDRPKDVKKLLSLEVTGGFINEAKEVPRAIFEMLQGRCGRYPKIVLDSTDPLFGVDDEHCRVLYGPTWFGVIMDTNPPDSDHWYYTLFEVKKPHNHSIYHQPSGVGTSAENKGHLPRGYYENMQAGKDKEWINVYVHGLYGFVMDGKPVWPEYKDDVHYEPNYYKPDPTLPLYVGIDFGLTPAAIIGQVTPSGGMVIFDELCTFDMGACNFGKILHEKLATTYLQFKDVEIYADPAGEGRAQTDEQTPFMILSQQKVNAFPTYTNDFTIRREVVADYMQRLDFSGRPAFLITPGAPTLRKACGGGYKYKRLQVAGEDRYQDKPDKGKYSHAGDALQYLFLGAVGGNRVIGGYGDKPIDYSQHNTGII